MKRTAWLIEFLAGLFALSALTASAAPAADVPAVVVGRVFEIEGDLLRYVPDEEDWVAVVEDAPFGAEDTYFSGNRGMAELIAPNGTWIRIGRSTQPSAPLGTWPAQRRSAP